MRLVLVDAANCLYRAFFALPPLRASDGFPTGALHGFTQMLRKVMREERPTAMAVVFDAPGPTFRKELYGEYKATRDAQPEELSTQFPLAREIAAASGIPVLEVAGFEADDVIASLVAHAPPDAEIVIVSTDRDLMQLVGERVVLLDTMRDRRIGPAEVEARFGVPPAKVLDVRALVGDTTDNIPGVKGIGEKGAAKLVQEWGSLEAVLAHASEIPAKRAREALESQAEAARLSKRLATLRTDAPGCSEPAALALTSGDRARLRELYARLELKRLLEALEGEDAGAPREAQGSLSFGAPQPLGAPQSGPPEAAEAPPEAGPAIETRLAEDRPALAALAKELASLPRFAVAFVGLEGPGGLPPEPVGVAFAATPASARYVPLGGKIGVAELAEALAPALGEAGPRRWIARESKRVQTLFAESGVPPALPAFDVEIAAFLLDPAGQHGSAALAARHLGRRLASFEELAGRGAKAISPAALPREQAAAWAGAEACALLALAEVLAAGLERDGLRPLFEEVELPLTAVLSAMEREGVRIDEDALVRRVARLRLLVCGQPELLEEDALELLRRADLEALAGELVDAGLEALELGAELLGEAGEGVRIDEDALAGLAKEFGAELERLEARIYELAGERFQIGSPKQLQSVLFEKLGLPADKKTKTGYSTDEGVLEQLAARHELPAYVLAHRRLAKLRSTYVEALPPLVNPRTGRIHPSFHQTGAATGRLSSSHPNVQNIPIRSESGVRIREAFVPAEGHRLLSADYSQVELRILAHYSGDESLVEAFASGADVHRRTAAEVAGIAPEAVSDEQRARAKAVNFGIIYGLSAFGLAAQLGIPSAEAQGTIGAYFARYGGVRRFLDETIQQARADGYVRTLLGRRRYLPDLASRNRVLRQAAERMAVNSVIQGTAADLMKKAMVDVAGAIRAEGLRARMILQVHDELVFDAPVGELEALAVLVRQRMEQVHALRVPLVVGIGVGENWREAH